MANTSHPKGVFKCVFFFSILNEAMTPATYLARYCRVNDRRKALYRRVFDKAKTKSEKEDFVDLRVNIFAKYLPLRPYFVYGTY